MGTGGDTEGDPRASALPRPRALCHSCPRSPQQAPLPQALGLAVCESQQAPSGPLLSTAHSARLPHAPRAPSPTASVPPVWRETQTRALSRVQQRLPQDSMRSPLGAPRPPLHLQDPMLQGSRQPPGGSALKKHSVKKQDQEDIKQKGCQHGHEGPCPAPQSWPPAPVLRHTPKVMGYQIYTPWRGSGTIWHCPLNLPGGKQGSVSNWPQPGTEEGLWVEEPRSGRGPHTPFPGLQ